MGYRKILIAQSLFLSYNCRGIYSKRYNKFLLPVLAKPYTEAEKGKRIGQTETFKTIFWV